MRIKSFFEDLWLGFAIVGAMAGALFPFAVMFYLVWWLLS